MSLLTEAEAAIKIGYSIELLKHFTKKCPKSGEDTLLKSKVLDGQTYYDEKDLNSYHAYLNKLWPLPPKGTRPTIPEAIKDDVKRESSYSCAICGHMDNGEVAHINAVAHSLNNAPDNLLFLCPNHHTKYDLGFKPDSNLTPEVIKAAKVLKRNSRQRILRYEANATKLLYTLIASLREVENQIKNARSKDMVAVLTTEMMELVYAIPGAVKEAQEYASADLDLSKTEKLLIKNSGNIAKLISQKSIKESEQNLRTTASSVLSLTSQIVIDIDEVECPHCAGRGQTGYAGDICAYCHGSCVVSHKKAEAYDREQIDEVDCPHCGGRGQTGLVGDVCALCKGSCVVSNDVYQAYIEKCSDR